MPPKDDAREQLLVEAAQKDPARFVELYERNFERVYAFVARRVQHRADAEDVTAEVFHQALANIAKFEWRGAPFVAWLYRIAANAIADRWQRASREQGSPASGDPADRSEAVDMEKSERAAQLFNFVNALPEDQRRVIEMRFAEEKSIREIAQALGRTPGAVKQLQFRGIQTLRAQFEREPGKKLSRSHG
ncbi:MAG TPA: sigma-70 family RNA polymerase sigma factor [Candidatus Acidoferrales bacterium]